MKKIIAVLLVSISFFSSACECPPIEPASKKICETYDVIFYGKVDSIIPCSTQGLGTVYFSIISLYKGAAEQHVSIDYDCTSACMMSFAKGEEWIIYSVYQHFDLLTVNLCSHSRKKITDGTVDFYEAASQRSFSAENSFLETTFGIQPYASHNALNDKQKEMQPHNEQPSAINKLWLLLISLAVMGIIFIISKKYFKNGK
ncbi:MAG: hypothetical protein JWO44_1623 [Bacteroidetes bacterium]|nr:hypothetical protein [Bacteroidota bacterium]